MPTFDLDLDIDDIIYEMSRREKEMMYEALKDEFDDENSVISILKDVKVNIPKNPSLMDETFLSALIKIYNNRDRLTLEEEDNFIKFSQKF
jgi:hypothetical protein